MQKESIIFFLEELEALSQKFTQHRESFSKTFFTFTCRSFSGKMHTAGQYFAGGSQNRCIPFCEGYKKIGKGIHFLGKIEHYRRIKGFCTWLIIPLINSYVRRLENPEHVYAGPSQSWESRLVEIPNNSNYTYQVQTPVSTFSFPKIHMLLLGLFWPAVSCQI